MHHCTTVKNDVMECLDPNDNFVCRNRPPMAILRIADWIMEISCSRSFFERSVNFIPFLSDGGCGEMVPDCRVTLGKALRKPSGEPLQVAHPDRRDIRIWKEEDGIFVEIVYADCVCCLHADAEWKNVETDVCEEDTHAVRKMNDVLMLSFAYSLAHAGGVLIHSSCVGLDNGHGAAFIGRSGIGKSTHSRLWLAHVPGTRLINDDQPAVRVLPDGRVYVYGTPWSGKTPCYKNDRAELKGIFCMEQARENVLSRLASVAAFGNLLNSTSLMRCDLSSYRSIVQTLSLIVERVPVYSLKNRPEKAAVDLSYGAIERR